MLHKRKLDMPNYINCSLIKKLKLIKKYPTEDQKVNTQLDKHSFPSI